jgi:DNA polymerase III subunit epsilon
MNLIRPLVILDVETTGTDVNKDRIVELSVLKLFPNGERESKTVRFNPEMPIPKGASDIHGITDEMVKGLPVFKRRAQAILDFIHLCDLGGFNSNKFDFPMLYQEFNRAGLNWEYSHHNMVDVGNIFKIKEARTLSAAVKFYCGVDHENAHSAEADVEATLEVLLAQVDRYEDLPKDIASLALFSNFDRPVLDMAGKFVLDSDNETVLINFGPQRGK